MMTAQISKMTMALALAYSATGPALGAVAHQRVGKRPTLISFPAVVRADLREMSEFCRDGTGDHANPNNPGSAAMRIDINHDGRWDYLVYQGAYDCGLASFMIPTAATGVSTKLYLGQADQSVTKVWSQDTWGPRTGGRGIRETYTFDMFGLACGDRRGDTVSVAARLACTLQLRPDAAGRWGLQPIANGKPTPIIAPRRASRASNTKRQSVSAVCDRLENALRPANDQASMRVSSG